MNKPRGLLWIKGNPGVGKSALMKFAVRTMNSLEPAKLVFSFFVTGRGTTLQKTPLGIFRSLLHNIIEYFPDHLAEVVERFKEQQQRYGDYHQERWKWNEHELQEYMTKILTQGTKDCPITIFVDALDECGTESAKKLLAYFIELTKTDGRQESQLRICFSSRHYPVIGLGRIPKILVEMIKTFGQSFDKS
jgi:Cdc6-like AAA superfamily ATPase